MTSLIILLVAVAVVATAVSFLTSLNIKTGFSLYLALTVMALLVDNYVVTPAYNIVKVDWSIEANSNHHASHRKTVLSYLHSEKWNESNLQKVSEEAINTVLKDLRGATKASSQEAYSRLECYLHETFNRYNLHGRAAVRCFGKTLNGSHSDNGNIRMWVSLLVDGTSNLKTVDFKVSLKPSIIEAAITDIGSTLSRWEEEEVILDAYNQKQDKLRQKCLDIWNRPLNENSERFSLRWLHEHCNSKYPSAWTVGDIK